MSTTLKTMNYGEIGNCGFIGPMTSIVHIREYEIPTEEFVKFAAYIMRGGLFGWGDGGVPEYVSKALESIKESTESQK